MKTIIKRDGTKAPFDLNKIIKAIEAAFVATDSAYTQYILEMLAAKAAAGARKNTVESLQDSVIETLYKEDFSDVARAYSEYRRKRTNIRQIKAGYVDVQETVVSLLGYDPANKCERELSVDAKENASTQGTVGAYLLDTSKQITMAYWLEEVYDEETGNAHKRGDIHIHDLSMLTGYCAGWSLKQLIEKGITGVSNAASAGPAKHLSVICNQMVNFLGIMQNEWAGAQAFSSVDTYLSAFVKKEGLSYKEVKGCIQSLIFGLNMPSRWGTQAPFSNFTLDWTVPEDLANLPAIVGGKEMDFKYKDCQPEMDMVNKAFIETMIEGDYNSRGFQYPIPTYSITKDFDWSDTENTRLLFEMTAKYGTPYFSNYINSDMKPSDVRSMCCRLRLDLRELRRKNGGFFGSGESTGSIGVVTVNLPRLAYLSSDEEDFYARLDRLMDIAARSLKVKRDVISVLLERGLYPYTKAYLGNFDNHFSTIGVCGGNEACLNANWLRCTLAEKKAREFMMAVLDHMRERLSDYQEQYGNLYNLEATPAESTMYRFARLDKEEFPDIVTGGSEGDTPYYTNSTHLPVDFTSDVFDALDIQDDFQTRYTSGTVFHAFLGEKLPSWQSAAALVRKIAENYKLPYFTLSPTYSVCKNHGYLVGEHFECPECGESAEVYSRITGYYRPVQNWNDGKVQEYKNRQTYKPETGRSEEDVKFTITTDKPLLFTTKTCPNCKIAARQLKEAGIDFCVVDAEEEQELSLQYNIMQAPTLVTPEGKKAVGVSAIISFIDQK